MPAAAAAARRRRRSMLRSNRRPRRRSPLRSRTSPSARWRRSLRSSSIRPRARRNPSGRSRRTGGVHSAAGGADAAARAADAADRRTAGAGAERDPRPPRRAAARTITRRSGGMSLLQRLGLGRSRPPRAGRAEADAGAPPGAAQRADARPERLTGRPMPRPPSRGRTAPGMPVSEYARRPAPQGLDQHGRQSPVHNPAEEDQLDIPAFLRRQAN